MMKKRTKGSDARHHAATKTGKFSAQHADAFQIVDEIVALREAVAAMEKSPLNAAMKAPAAVRRLLEIIENLNLRVAELESRE